ncbi:ABC transporter ATP-binding protein [Phytohabitans sp. ZYX-F-186]|uniref:ABC transporter ATP-binding protein n=1 Tax=Phytohabitans maris TaxID=3071409 RepID=A0ABU0ZKD7_9ACTN|nr:ABC transporter ATP-binding protein [Phytohabitans sp. ZYX-F-186]MDQ7907514.1 ABC transporter ATP-binding protein [Phytohabitans sp. ZYX-F-186]
MDTERRTGHIEIRKLRKRYEPHDEPAVDDIDLTIESGEFITLLGPSGSGKTTTLNMIAGFVQPTSGTIRLNSRDLAEVPTHKRNFGMVFQNYALFPHMTVFDNVAYPLRQRRLPREKTRTLVGDILALFGLGGMESRKPDQLSGGQQQRVALARAVVFSPAVLLLDEPLGALDRKLRQALQAEVKRLHRDLGLTFVFVTHDQDEAMFLSDTVAVFNKGRVERVGTPGELYDDPGTLFVAGFLGEANVFAGSLVDPTTYLWMDRKWRVAGPPRAGDTVLVVRPEKVRVFDLESVPEGWNSTPAVVTDRSHLGAVCKVDMTFPDGATGSATMPTDAAVTVRPGESVLAAWEPGAQAFVQPERA